MMRRARRKAEGARRDGWRGARRKGRGAMGGAAQDGGGAARWVARRKTEGARCDGWRGTRRRGRSAMGGAAQDGGGAARWVARRKTEGARRDGWRWIGTPTPHLTSPLEGGRDELGKSVGDGMAGFLPAQE